MLTAVASLGMLIAAGETIRWNTNVELQARGRDEPAGLTDQAGRAGLGELDLHGQLGLSAQGPDGVAALTWSPQLLLRQVVFGAPVETGNATRQGGRLELQTRLAPATRLTSRTVLDWGLTDFSPLSGQVTPPVAGLLPSHRFVRTLGVETMLDLTHAFSRRLLLSVAGGVQRSGGLGHEAAQVLPFQVGPRANASLAWVADRSNALTLLASASTSRFSNGFTSVLSDVQAGWTLRASAHTLLDAAAGLTLIHSSGADTSSGGAYGSGMLGVGWDLPMAPQRTLLTSLRARLSPGIDRLTALAIQTVRAEGVAELREGRLRLGVSGSRARAISGAGAGADDLRFEARSSWIFTAQWSTEIEVGGARTNQLPFTGWQGQAWVGLRWGDRGSF
jgi:hypothetical protein